MTVHSCNNYQEPLIYIAVGQICTFLGLFPCGSYWLQYIALITSFCSLESVLEGTGSKFPRGLKEPALYGSM